MAADRRVCGKRNRRVAEKRMRRELAAGLNKALRAWLMRLAGPIQWRVDAYNTWLEKEGGPLTPRGRPRQCLDKLARDEGRLLNIYALLARGELVEREDQADLAALLTGGGAA